MCAGRWIMTRGGHSGWSAETGHAAALMGDGYMVLRGAAPTQLIAAIASDLAPRFAATPFCEGGFYGERTKRFGRSEEHTSELQSLMRISYAVFCLKKKQY